jgi:hypothetical protein
MQKQWERSEEVGEKKGVDFYKLRNEDVTGRKLRPKQRLKATHHADIVQAEMCPAAGCHRCKMKREEQSA